jgi:DNA mismatch repair protein MutS
MSNTSYIRKIDKVKNKSIIEVYLEIQQEYVEKFGDKTIVLFENGSFFEFYQTIENGKDIGKAKEVAELLNMILTRKDKSIDEISIKNPYMAGFPTHSADRHLDVLIENNWTVVMIEQITTPPNPERAITRILSKNTDIDRSKSSTDNYILSLSFFIEKNGKVYCGWSVIDLFIGKIFTEEIFENYIEDIRKLVLFFRPNEVIINIQSFYESFDKSKFYDDFCDQLNLFNKKVIIQTQDDIVNNVSYQNKYFQDKFKTEGLLSTIEILDLEMKEYARKSLISLLKYCEEYNPAIISNLSLPKPFDNNDYVRLENNAIEQLEIFTSKRGDLFNIIDKTSTSIGKRYLLFNLLHPICDIKKLNERYTLIEKYIPIYKKIEEFLEKITDLEKLNRKWCINKLQPYELYNYYNSLINIIKCKEFLTDDCINDKEIFDEIDFNFIVDNLRKSSLKNIYLNIFKNDDEINKLHECKDSIKTNIYTFCEEINKKCKEDIFKLEYTESNIYYLKTTNKKWDLNQSKLITEYKDLKKDNSMKSYSKITHPYLNSLSFSLESIKDTINKVSNEKYLMIITEMYKKFKNTLNDIIDYVQNVDLYKTLAKISSMYKYNRPVIKECSYSFIDVKDIRHAILERLNEKVYITNDVMIGNGSNILLYGCNSSGKSVLLKAVGLSIILAQIGCFVPCKEMIFNPFKKIYTRILTNDNIYQGHSSFMTEMIELKRILDNSDIFTISLCDELTHGTESSSGTSIMIATILKLVENSNFFFTSHLHNVYEHPLIKDIVSKKIKILHMSVIYDKEKDCIVYDRKLKEGGGNKLYGVEFLKALHFEKIFLDTCLSIRDENEDKVSKYNKNLIVSECLICKSKENLHTHHIKEQHLSDENGMIGSMHKNTLENLVTLCEKCHQKTHQEKITIEGYKDTSLGKNLIVKLEKIEDKDSIKEKIFELRKEKNSQAKIKEKLEEIGVKISIKKISEILKI